MLFKINFIKRLFLRRIFIDIKLKSLLNIYKILEKY